MRGIVFSHYELIPVQSTYRASLWMVDTIQDEGESSIMMDNTPECIYNVRLNCKRTNQGTVL